MASSFKPIPFLLLSLLAVAASGAGAKRTHLHFFVHDILSSPNATAVRVAKGPMPLYSNFNFGDIVVFDDPVTVGPNRTSKLVARAQGFYAFTSQSVKETAMLLTMNVAFTEGKYNGSTLVIQGFDPVLMPVREIPVVGGSGRFRLARGYAIVKPQWIDVATGDGILEWDVYAMHH